MGSFFRAVLVGALVLALAGCGDDNGADGKNSPLAYVPADTPYVVANLETANEQTAAQIYKTADARLPGVVADLREASKRLRDEDNKQLADFASTLADELDGNIQDLLARDGIDPRAPTVIYGVGLSPVVRLPLADGDKFDQFVQRIVDASGQKFSDEKLSDRSYRQTLLGDGKLRLIVSRNDGTGVVALLPADAGDDMLATVLGTKKPEQSMQDSGRLKKLADERGYLESVGIGYFDITRLPGLLTDDYDPMLAVFAPRATPADSESCRADLKRVASRMPRVTMGYTTLEPKSMAMQYNIDLAPDIAEALGGIETKMPGASADSEAALDVMWSLPVDAVRKFVKAQARAVQDKPFECGPLVRWNQQFAALGRVIDKAAIPPLGGLTGLRLSLQSVDYQPGNRKPPKVKGIAIIGSDRPEGLMAMASSFAPSLQRAQIKADGKAIALDGPMVNRFIKQPVAVALTDKAVGVGIGGDEDSRLEDFIGADTGDDETPFFRLHLSGPLAEKMTQMAGEIYGGYSSARAPGDSSNDAVTEAMENAKKTVAQWKSVDFSAAIENKSLVLEFAKKTK